MDCGFAMRYTQETHNYPKKSFAKYVSYLCGNYTRSGAGACSAHTNYLKPLAELVPGTVPEAMFKNLLTKYEAERVEKQSLVQEPKKSLADTAQDERDIEQYLQSIKKYIATEQLDREMLLELIKYIEI